MNEHHAFWYGAYMLGLVLVLASIVGAMVFGLYLVWLGWNTEDDTKPANEETR